MSKKEANSFIFEGEKIKPNFFEEDNEDDKIELKNLHNILTNSSNKIEEEDDNKDLNNITSVSETDEVYINEVKDATKKSQESEYEIEDELNETSLTNKNIDEEEEKNPKNLDDVIENNNIINKNINNIDNIIKNEIELNGFNKINRNNLNNQNQLFNDIKNEEDEKNNKTKSKKEKHKNKNRNKNPIFLIKKIKKRSKMIQLLRKKKGLHIIRKKDSDTIRRKIKTYFHNYFLNLFKLKTKKLNIKKEKDNLDGNIIGKKSNKKKINKFLKFNNKFTTNVTINSNRSLLLKRISHILTIEPISSKYKAYDLHNNCYLTKYLLELKTFPEIHKILNFTYMESYNEFLNSEKYKNILKKIKIKDGELYLNKFQNVSNNFISYFQNAKPKKEPKNEVKKKFFVKDKPKKEKEKDKDKEIKNSLNFSGNDGNDFVNNSSIINESYKFKNIQEMLNINPVNNNNMSLVEEFHDFFNHEEKEIIDLEYSNEINHDFGLIQNFNENSYYIENGNSFEKKDKLFLKDEYKNIGINQNMEFFFEKNNLSEIIDSDFIQKSNNFHEEEDSMAICKKSTNDY